MGELERCYGLAATGTHSRIIFTQREAFKFCDWDLQRGNRPNVITYLVSLRRQSDAMRPPSTSHSV
jgi:hypothetical protein